MPLIQWIMQNLQPAIPATGSSGAGGGFAVKKRRRRSVPLDRAFVEWEKEENSAKTIPKSAELSKKKRKPKIKDALAAPLEKPKHDKKKRKKAVKQDEPRATVKKPEQRQPQPVALVNLPKQEPAAKAIVVHPVTLPEPVAPAIPNAAPVFVQTPKPEEKETPKRKHRRKKKVVEQFPAQVPVSVPKKRKFNSPFARAADNRRTTKRIDARKQRHSFSQRRQPCQGSEGTSPRQRRLKPLSTKPR